MSSNWTSEIGAVFEKEAKTELRTRTGLVTSGVFALATIVTVSLALYNKNPNDGQLRDISASLVWVILLFSCLLTLPRSFLAEEELGTADLLRLTARPHAVYWGKMLFNVVQTWLLALFVGLLFFFLTGLHVLWPGILVGSLVSGGAALAGTVTFCGAVAAQATNRAALAGAIAIPLVLVPTEWGVSSLRAAVGVGAPGPGAAAVAGLSAYAVLCLILGPWVYALVWKI